MLLLAWAHTSDLFASQLCNACPQASDLENVIRKTSGFSELLFVTFPLVSAQVSSALGHCRLSPHSHLHLLPLLALLLPLAGSARVQSAASAPGRLCEPLAGHRRARSFGLELRLSAAAAVCRRAGGTPF